MSHLKAVQLSTIDMGANVEQMVIRIMSNFFELSSQ